MKTLKKIIATTAMVLLAHSTIYAANGPMLFSDIDSNNDGVVNQNEYKIAKEKRVKEKTEDGRLLRNANKTDFSDIDANGDGAITQEEFRNHQLNRFQNRPGMGIGKQ